MAFVDNLAYSLFALSFAGFMLLYTVSRMYLVYRAKKVTYPEQLRSASVPLGIIGGYMLVMGLWGQFTWLLPGSYNILFYDPFVSLGMLLVAFAGAVRYSTKLEYVGFLAMMVGVMTLVYGSIGYSQSLTAEPIALLALYLIFGLTAVLAYPVSMIADRLPGLQRKVWFGWHIILASFWVLLLASSVLAAFIGFAAIPQHLLSAP